MSTTVLAVEGVLSTSDDLVRSPIEADGLLLYGALAAMGKLVLASNVEQRLVRHWLRASGLTRHATVVPLTERTVTALRANGEDVTLYVDSDPERTAAALRNGVRTLLYARPLYARASHRPDLPQLQRPWAELVAESRAQHSARALHVPADVTYDEG